jgi:hypothetical protein
MPLFQYTTTLGATNKEHLDLVERDVEEFIQIFLKRGVKTGNKDGTGIVGATFKPGTRLEQRNVEWVTALILDVDGKFKRNGEVVMEPVDPDWFIGQLPFRGIAHTSYNHTPTHPKFRVILPLEKPISMTEHRRLWYWVFHKRVDMKCDPACKNADRMFFLPRAPQGAIDQKWPWVRELHGQLLNMDVIPADFQAPDEGAHEKPVRRIGLHFSQEAPRATVGGLKVLEDFMRQPLIVWALDNPAAVSREVWRGIGLNLAHIAKEEEGNEALAEACLQAYHDISAADGDRYSFSGTLRMYRDCEKSALKYGPMTFSHMLENGAPDDVAVEDQKTPLSAARANVRRNEWHNPKVETPSAEAPAPGVPSEPIANLAATAAAAILAADDSGEPDVPDEDKARDIFDLHQENFLHDTANDFYLMKDGRGSWDTVPPMKASALDRMLKSLGVPGKKLDDWKMHVKSFNGRAAFYDKPTEAYVVQHDVPFFNTYRPSLLVPSPGNWDDIRLLLMNLVDNDPKAFDFLLDWLALPLQSLKYKGKAMKMGTAIVLQGEHGAGKGTLHNILNEVYGASNITMVTQDFLDSRFNGMLADKLFVTANEVMSSSNRSMEIANRLKTWITEPHITLEEKFVGTSLRPNNFNIMFDSNDERPVIIERGDRRYSVFESRVLDRAITNRIYVDLLGPKKNVAAFYDHLLTRKCTIVLGDRFDSAARDNLMSASAHSDEKFVHEIVMEGWYTVAETWRAEGRMENPRQVVETDELVVPSDTLQQVYQHFCKLHSLRARGGNSLTKTVKTLLPQAAFDRRYIGGVRTRVYTGFPMHAPGEVIDLQSKKEERQLAEKTRSDHGDFAP